MVSVLCAYVLICMLKVNPHDCSLFVQTISFLSILLSKNVPTIYFGSSAEFVIIESRSKGVLQRQVCDGYLLYEHFFMRSQNKW